MKKILLSGIALAALAAAPSMAADLQRPVMKAPPMMAPQFSWTGFYIGPHIGGAWTQKDWSQTGPAGFLANGPNAASYNATNFIGGGQIGYNMQFSNWLIGIEGDVSWGGGRTFGSAQTRTPSWTSNTDVNWIATLTGRLGLALDRVLLYVKGGGAWVGEDQSQTFNGPQVASFSETRGGWTVGGGVEYAFVGNWSAKAEYAYLDFGTRNAQFGNNPAVVPAARTNDNWDIKQRIQEFKFGVNYRFGP
jgi:outer membrane immunogenic protein